MPSPAPRTVVLTLVAVLPLVLVLAIYAGFRLAYSGCDLHDERRSASPDGRWQARWQTEGCHGRLDSMMFHSAVAILPGASPASTAVPTVFEDDSPDAPRLTWTDPHTLNIEIPSLATISKSLSAHGEVSITYSVPPLLRQDLVDIDARDAQGPSGAVQEASAREVDRFRQWVQRHAPITAMGSPRAPVPP